STRCLRYRGLHLLDGTACASVTLPDLSLHQGLLRLSVQEPHREMGGPEMVQNEDGWVGPEFPSLGAIVLGTFLFATGGMLLLTVIGTPLGIVMLPVGVGLLTTPKERDQ